jgi:hypothetical protein
VQNGSRLEYLTRFFTYGQTLAGRTRGHGAKGCYCLHASPTALAPSWFDEMELVGKVMRVLTRSLKMRGLTTRGFVDCPKLGAREAVHSGIL